MTCDEDIPNNTFYRLNKNSKKCVKIKIVYPMINEHLKNCKEIGEDGKNCLECKDNNHPMLKNSKSLKGCSDTLTSSTKLDHCEIYDLKTNNRTTIACK